MNWKLLLGIIGVVIFLIGFGVWGINWSGGHPMLLMGLGLILLILSLGLSYREVQGFALKRAARYGLMSIAMSVIVSVIMVFVVLISLNHPTRWDLSENRRFSLAPQTRQLLKNLDQPVHVVGFFESLMDLDVSKTEDLLAEMKRFADGKLTFETIDARRNPELAFDYRDELGKSGLPSIFVTRNDESLGVTVKERAKGLTEPDVTNALIRLTRERQARVYFLYGHEEREIDRTDQLGYSAVKSELENLQYTVADFHFTRAYQLPEDCDVLAICGPETDLYPEELQAIDGYIRRGGRALIMLDPEKAPNLASQLRAYGLDVKDDVVVEANVVGDLASLFTGQFRLDVVPRPMIGPSGYNQTHDITRGFTLQTQYALARSVMPLSDKPEGITVTKLAETSSKSYNDGQIPGSWGEADIQAVMGALRARQPITAQFDAATDTRGPVSLVTAVTLDLNQLPDPPPTEERINDEEARLVVFGDSDFCLNQNVSYPGQIEIVTNAFSWLAEQEDLISPEMAKVTRNTSFILTGTQQNTIMICSVFFAPVAIVIIGILNAIRRRKFA